MKTKKRLLSLLLCGAMLFSLCPQAVSAEGVQNSEQAIGSLCEHQPALSVENVQKLIDALPTAEALADMSQDEQGKVYNTLQTAYDAYEALSDAEKLEVSGADIFEDLFAVFNGMTNTLADSGFTVEGGESGTDYELNNNTLTIKTSKSLTISTTGTDTITGQIVIAENVNADLKLNGVNIKGSQYSTARPAKSAIELSSGSSLTLTLSQDSENTLAGGAGGESVGAPGIHVPQNASLTVLCAAAGDNSGHICDSSCGKSTIKGGPSDSSYGGVGIGGGIIADSGSYTGQPCGTVLLLGGNITVTGGTGSGSDKARDIGGGDGSGSGAGGAGGTVIILTGVQSNSGALDIGGGVQPGENADNGAGIKPGTGSNTYEVYGDLTLSADLTIPAGVTVNIPSGLTLTVPSGKTLTNYGSITGEGTLGNGGTFDNHGTVNVTTNNFNNNTVVGAFHITGGTNGTDYTYADGVLTVNNGANLTISMADNTATTSDRIVIAQNATATITLDGVEIKAPQQTSAIELSSGSKLTLILPTNSTSSLEGGTWNSTDLTSSGSAGIHVPNGTELHIKCSQDGNQHTCSETSCGKLSVKGEAKSAGIGGNEKEGCGTVVIDGGMVTATGGSNAAGIGGGDNGSGGDITINGGSVTAIGNLGGAGIGGAGGQGPGGKVTITGGIVTASDTPNTAEAGNAAGIGGGYESAGGEVIITGGVVIATGHGGAGIGGGTGATDGTFNTNIDSTTGNAVIFASGTDGDIGDLSNYSNWSGVIFQGTVGKVYGNVTLTDSFTIPGSYTLTIPDGATLTIPEGVIITNNGTIDVVDGGKIEPESRVNGSGTVRRFYTVTFDANGHGTAPEETLVLKGGFISQPTAPTADGYTFGGWYKDGAFTELWNFDTDAVTAKTILYAKWTRNSTGGSGGGGSSYDYFTITASAGAGGSISPSGSVSVGEGRDKTFTITPDKGYRISDVLVDGKSVGAVKSYTFEDVQKGHSIEAVFAKENPSTGGNPFTDVKESDWFYGDVMFAYEKGLMSGTRAATFEPNADTTRAQIAAVFCRLDGSPAVEGRNNYTDVEYGSWYYDAVTWARQSGVMSGYGNNLFGPNDPVTRQQLAATFCNYANYKGYDVTAAGDLSGFTDAGEISPWAQDAVKWAVGIGLMNGKGGGILDPQGTATRAEVAAMLRSFITLL